MELRKINEELEFLAEMAKAGSFLQYEVLIHPKEKEGNIPHFHLHVPGMSFDDDICIKLDKPEYFIHGSHSGMLNHKERKNLQVFLLSKRRNISRWDFLVDAWETAYPNKLVSADSCPDYTELPAKN